MNFLRVLNITVITPDNRVMLHRGCDSSLWGVTFEKHLLGSQMALPVANKIFWEVFGVDTGTYADEYVELIQWPQMVFGTTSFHPFLARFNTGMAFSIQSSEKCKAVKIEELTDDLLRQAFSEPGTKKEYTGNAIRAVNLLKSRGVCD